MRRGVVKREFSLSDEQRFTRQGFFVVGVLFFAFLVGTFFLEDGAVILSPPPSFVDDGTLDQVLDGCGALTTTGATYTLENNISGIIDNCITIVADDIIINGQGFYFTTDPSIDVEASIISATDRDGLVLLGLHYVTEDGADRGLVVNFTRVSNSIISDISFEHFGEGIFINASENVSVIDSSFYDTNNETYSVSVYNSRNTSISRATVFDAGAIFLEGNVNTSIHDFIRDGTDSAHCSYGLYVRTGIDTYIDSGSIYCPGGTDLRLFVDASRIFVSDVILVDDESVWPNSLELEIQSDDVILNNVSASDYLFGGTFSSSITLDSPDGSLELISLDQDASGTDLTSDFSVSYNEVILESGSFTGANAFVTLTGLPTEFSNPVIYGSSSECTAPECVQISDLNNGTVTFFITDSSFDRYFIEESGILFVSACDVLDSAGSIYYLTTDITGAPGSCFSILAENVSFNGDDHFVSGNGVGEGILLVDADGFFVSDLLIEEFEQGVLVQESDSGVLQRVTSNDNSQHGVLLANSSNVLFEEGIVSENLADGIYLDGTTLSTIDGAMISENANVGVSFNEGSDANIVLNSDLINNSGFSAHYLYSVSNNFSNNYVEGSGIRVWSLSHFNSFVNNTFFLVNDVVINTVADELLIANNSFRDSDKGIQFTFSDNSSIVGNTFSQVESGEAVFISSSKDVVIHNNSFYDSGGLGGGVIFVRLDSNNSVVSENVIESSNRHGILIGEQAINGGPRNISVIDNRIIDSGDTGLILENVSGSFVLGNVIESSAGEGILVENSDNTTFMNNIIVEEEFGIYVGLGARDNYFVNETVISETGIFVLNESTGNVFDFVGLSFNGTDRSFVGFSEDGFKVSPVEGPEEDDVQVPSHLTPLYGFFSIDNITEEQAILFEVSYSDSDLSAGGEDALFLGKQDSVVEEWILDTSVFANDFGVNKDENYFYANITDYGRFTTFALLVDESFFDSSGNGDDGQDSNDDGSSGGNSGGGGGGSGGGGSSATTNNQETTGTIEDDWISTVYEDSEDLSERETVTVSLAERERVQFSVNGEVYFVGISSLTSTTAAIVLSHDGLIELFFVGESVLFDADNDEVADFEVRLDDLVNGEEGILTISFARSVLVEEPTSNEGAGLQVGKVRIPLWWIWIVIVVIVAIGLYFSVRFLRKQHERRRYRAVFSTNRLSSAPY